MLKVNEHGLLGILLQLKKKRCETNTNNTAQQNFFFLGALVFRPFPGVIWGAVSENDIG